MSNASGYILVGGKSSRLGRDKALVKVEGRPLALWLAEALRPAVGRVTLVGQAPKYEHLGLRIIPDPVENFGPLAGILAALEDSDTAWNLVLACDMPYLTSDFLAFLIRKTEESDADITLPVDAEGRPEPLCAVYASRCGPTFRSALEKGTHKITSAFGALRVLELQPGDCAPFNADGRLFSNLNTAGDFDDAGVRLDDHLAGSGRSGST